MEIGAAATPRGKKSSPTMLDDYQMSLFADLFQAELASDSGSAAEIFDINTNKGEETMPRGRKKNSTDVVDAAVPKLTLSSGLLDYRRDIWEVMAKKELAAQPDKAKAYLLGLTLSGDAKLINKEEMGRHYKAIAKADAVEHSTFTASSHFYAPDVFKLTPEQKEKLFTAAAVSTVSNIPDGLLVNLLKYLDVTMSSHWEIDAEFLGLLTKVELDKYLDFIGVSEMMGKKYEKAKAGKKTDFITTIISSGFSFSGIIPEEMDYAVDRQFK